MGSRRACRICSSEGLQPRFIKDGFRIEKCMNCGLMQVTNPPAPSEIGSYYENGFFDEHYSKLQTDPKRLAYEYEKFNFRLKEIEKRTTGKGRILDVGCSFGFFLDVARKRGWKVYGVEISEYASNHAKRNLGLNVVNKDLIGARFDTGFFDIVTLWNVLEHLHDPVELMNEVYRILKEKGIVVLTTGDIESPLARLKRGRWRMLIPPIHLSHFSPSTINYLLDPSGLDLIEQTYALPYEFLLEKWRLLGIFRRFKVSDKMLIYAGKT